MYRKPGSTMSAVDVVYSMYDGPVPADVMAAARAEDAEFAASNPNRKQLSREHLEEERINKERLNQMFANFYNRYGKAV